MSPEDVAKNETILDTIEGLGGGYVWEPEVFAVTLMDVALTDEKASLLTGLIGVEQIALNASRLSSATVEAVAQIPGLKSLVLSGIRMKDVDLNALKRIGPAIQLVEA